MLPLAVAILFAVPQPNPLPDGKTIDTLTFSFSDRGPFGPNGSFSMSASGKLSYGHQTAPHTGSGGIVTSKSWEIPKAEAAMVLTKLLEDGLLDLPEADETGWRGRYTFRVSTGKWQAMVAANPVPERILAHLRPYLEKAHPVMWKKPEPPKDTKPVLTRLTYSFAEKVEGQAVILTVTRSGGVSYTRRTHPTAPGGQKDLISQGWGIPKADAAKLLEALTADGLFDLVDTGGQKFPNHSIDAYAGRWRTVFYPKELPDAVMKHLRPLLEKADPEVWKKP